MPLRYCRRLEPRPSVGPAAMIASSGPSFGPPAPAPRSWSLSPWALGVRPPAAAPDGAARPQLPGGDGRLPPSPRTPGDTPTSERGRMSPQLQATEWDSSCEPPERRHQAAPRRRARGPPGSWGAAEWGRERWNTEEARKTTGTLGNETEQDSSPWKRRPPGERPLRPLGAPPGTWVTTERRAGGRAIAPGNDAAADVCLRRAHAWRGARVMPGIMGPAPIKE